MSLKERQGMCYTKKVFNNYKRSVTLKMTSTQVVETSVANNNFFHNCLHPNNHTAHELYWVPIWFLAFCLTHSTFDKPSVSNVEATLPSCLALREHSTGESLLLYQRNSEHGSKILAEVSSIIWQRKPHTYLFSWWKFSVLSHLKKKRSW